MHGQQNVKKWYSVVGKR